MLYGEKEHARVMKKLEEYGKILLNDPEKMQDLMFRAGVIDKDGKLIENS